MNPPTLPPPACRGFLAFFGLATAVSLLAGEPFVPASDQTVLARLSVAGAPSRTGAEAPAKPIDDPTLGAAASVANDHRFDPSAAVPRATELVRQARAESDPRLLSRARGLLSEVWTNNSAPFEVRLLRAEIHQGLHAFTPALHDLELALRENPRHVGAWLLKASIHQVRGEYPAARHATLQLARLADELVSATAAAALAGLGPQAENAALQLARVIERPSDAPAEIRAWALATLGDIQARLGRVKEAESSFQRALKLDPLTPYPRAALADLWLDQGRGREVLELLGESQADALQLRRAEAEHQLFPDRASTRVLIEQIRDGFRLAQARGDELHQREHARFLLHLEGDPRAALELARRNFEVQKEPEDVRLLLEAAEAVGDEAQHRGTWQWAEAHQPATLRQSRRFTRETTHR